MRRLAAIAATVALTWSPPHSTLGAKPACPVVVDRLVPHGMAVQMSLRNQAPYSVRNLAVHVMFTDVTHQARQATYQDDILVQAHQTMVFTTPPITAYVVLWSTL